MTRIEGNESEAPEVPAWDRRLDRRAALVLLLLVLGVYLFTGQTTVSQNNDSRAAALAAWSLGTHGTVALPDGWDPESVSWHAEGADGRLYVNRFPGVILWGAPFYAVSGLITGDRGTPVHPHLIDYRPAAVAAATATALGVLVSFWLFRRLTDRRTAVAAALVLAFATSVWSISGTALWTHGVTHLMLALGMVGVARERQAGAGLAYAFAVFTRPQTAIVPAVVGVWEGAHRRRLRPVVVLGVTSVLGLIGMVAYSRTIFGTWMPISGYGSYGVTNIVETGPFEQGRRLVLAFVDPRRGLLLYAPFLLLLVPGLRAAWRSAPPWVRSSAVAGVAYFLVQLRVNDFDGGTYFIAYRLPIEMLVLTAPLLVLSYDRFVRRNMARITGFVVLVAVAAFWQVVGVVHYSSEDILWEFYVEEVHDVCADPEIDCDPAEIMRPSRGRHPTDVKATADAPAARDATL